jgi:hypothetical protein
VSRPSRARIDDLAAAQDGVVARGQLLGIGLTPAQARAAVDAHRWRRLHHGVYATFTGPVPDRARLWAAVLRAGAGAVAGPTASLWLAGLVEVLPDRVDVCVPAAREVTQAGELRVVRRRGLAALVQPASAPPRLRLEVAVLDVAASSQRPEAVVGLVLRAVQNRRTTPERLRAELAGRRTHPWRSLLAGLLADAQDGAHSALELRYLRDVERAHRLPRGARNTPERTPSGRTRYRDVRYRGLVIELDGVEAHPADRRFRDRARDNEVALAGELTLRYGWHEVVADPCAVAAQVATALRRQGWRGRPKPCSRAGSCPVRGPDPARQG